LDKLGAHDNDRAAFSWFFEKAYETPITSLTDAAQNWVLSMASYLLQAQGRLAEALPTQRQSLFMNETAKRWGNAARSAANLSEIELTLGKIADANASAERAVIYADDTDDDFLKIFSRSLKANALAASGGPQEAGDHFIDAERRQKKWQPDLPLLYSYQGYHRYDFLLANGEYDIVVEQTDKTLQWAKSQGSRLDVALHTLILGRAHLGVALRLVDRGVYAAITAESVDIARSRLGEALEGLRVSGTLKHLPSALIARSCLRRCLGDWAGAKRDLDEVNEIAESGLMRLGLCDMALKLARLVLARVETFAPLNGLVGDSPPKPEALSEVECVHLRAEASKQLTIASGTIEKCGYRRRDEELDELRSVLNSGLTFARLPPRV
jgi:tetratricopeptide (TPR) repeat protein